MGYWQQESRSRYIFILLSLISSFFVKTAIGESISPKTIFTAFENNTKQSQNIILNGQALEAQVGALKGVYDPQIAISSGYEVDRNESLSGLRNLEDKSFQTQIRLSKKFRMGTTAELNYSLIQQQSELNPFTQSLRDSALTENKFTVSMRQPFLYNTLGASDRLNIVAAELKDEAQKMHSQEQSEELLLQGLEIFWMSYRAQRSLALNLEAREIYKKLLETTQKQRRLGQADVGDVARVEAIFELQSQKVKRDSAQYLNQIESLFHFLEREAPQSDLKFDIPEKIPAPPTESEPDLKVLRRWKIENASMDSIEAEKGAYRMRDLPVLDVVGEASWNGVDGKASQSLSEAIGGTRPRYYVGVEFGFNFGNSGTRSKISNLTNQLTIQKNEMSLTKDSIALESASLQRRIQSLYQITQSAERSVKLYRTLVNSQSRNYRQGRIQLNVLIEDYTRLFDSELLAIDSLSNYHIALHRWAAHTDQLIQTKN